jgi:soluble lytic murein transglycosylase-like protein
MTQNSNPSAVPQEVLLWRPLARNYSSVHPVLSPEEILAIIWSESSGNPDAENPADPSWGLMQVTLPIAKHFTGVSDKQKLLDPETNIRAGSFFLAYLKQRYAALNPLLVEGKVSPIGWVAAYNEGEPNLWRKRPDPGYVQAFVSHLRALGAEVS